MARATSSLPVPVSPWMSTVLFIGDTISSVWKSWHTFVVSASAGQLALVALLVRP